MITFLFLPSADLNRYSVNSFTYDQNSILERLSRRYNISCIIAIDLTLFLLLNTKFFIVSFVEFLAWRFKRLDTVCRFFLRDGALRVRVFLFVDALFNFLL